MRYSPNEKAKMDEILKVFQSYISSSAAFDIATAPKLGYFLCTCYNAEENGIDVEFIDDADSLIQALIDEIYYDVLFEGGSKNFDDRRVKAVEPEVIRRVSEYTIHLPQLHPALSDLVAESAKRKLTKEH